MTRQRRRGRLLGVPLDLLDMASTVRAIEEHVDRGGAGCHLGVNAANVVLAQDDPAYQADLEAADLVTADGMSVVWSARLFGMKAPERVAGIDLMEALLERARSRDWAVYLLGARRGVVTALVARLEASGIRVAGWRDGYFAPDDDHAAATAARASGATLLFVGMPSPRKERFIVHEAREEGIPFSIGVGGSFDVLSGKLRRAPRVMQQLGLEWLFRLLQEPRRLFRRYAVTNARFVILVFREARRKLRSGR